jgi:signal transduction histidine kinase
VRHRITLGLVAILVVALVVSGSVGYQLVRQSAANTARTTVLGQATRFVAAVHATPRVGQATPDYATLLPEIEAVAGITEAAVVIVDSKGGLVSAAPSHLPGALFGGVPGQHVAAGHDLSGVHGAFAYAAVPLVSGTAAGGQTIALVLVTPVRVINGWYFLVAGGISLLVTAGLAAVFTSRVSRRVVAAERAAEAIANGNLAARVQTNRRDYPELKALSESINTMAASLEQSRELDRYFLLSISHDLRTPLTSIRGYAEAIIDGATPDPPRAAGVIVAQADRLQRLIADLLQLARLESSNFDFDPSQVDPGAIVDAAASALAYAFERAHVGLERSLEETPPVEADADRLAQIVTNLLENALKFAATTVTVSVLALDGTVAIAVEDDGPGIGPEDLPHVFDRLYTAGRDAARQAGTGLGLAIVAELSAAMGTDVAIDSPLGPDGGTRFTVRIPAAHETPIDLPTTARP